MSQQSDVPQFVSDQGSAGEQGEHPAKKVKRSSQACDSCHRGRRRCDNRKPKCSECVQRNHDCTYNNPTRKRGPKHQHVDKVAERSIAIICRNNPELEQAMIHELLHGVDLATGQRNIDRLNDAGQKVQLVADFDNTRIANILNDYAAGVYENMSPAPTRQVPGLLPTGPLAYGLNALPNSNADESGQQHSLQPMMPPTAGAFGTTTFNNPGNINMQHQIGQPSLGPAFGGPSPSPFYNPPGFHTSMPVPPSEIGGYINRQMFGQLQPAPGTEGYENQLFQDQPFEGEPFENQPGAPDDEE
ncbi:hypothetical protein F5X99DRAFT_409793 [Biscogniauxia marginata]|nr:hypothetical protein F5X99DRAFT_409793 [Biscogniauxia marginata]